MRKIIVCGCWQMAAFGCVLASALQAGPVGGPTARELRLLPAGDTPYAVEFALKFTAGQRACIIVRGDHKPPVPLEIAVYGSDAQLVAEDKSDQDILAAIWTPARTGEYRVVLRNYGRDHYAKYPDNQKFTDVWLSIK